MPRRGDRTPREKASEEEMMKSAGRKAEQGAEDYPCTGLLEQDFPELCARAGIAAAPKITLRPPPSFPAEEEPGELAEVLAGIEHKYRCLQPRIQVERGDPEDPHSARALFLRGWKLEEEMLGVLSRCLPALGGLQAVHLWKVGLSERLLPALAALLARCPRLRTLSLEGNPLAEPAFHTLMGSDSALAHLSLRNNSLGDADARLVGQSLVANRSLVSLVLSFNRISDLGAGSIAQGLRLNRSLLSLSLASNDIGDAGAVQLAEVLAPFALTHAEAVERRRLLFGCSQLTPREPEGQSEGLRSQLLLGKQSKAPLKKKGQQEPPRKEEAKQQKRLAPEPRVAHRRSNEKLSLEGSDRAEALHPLLQEVQQLQGSLVLPGNRALLNLNLTHNRVTERGLGAFVAALEEQQRDKEPKVPGRRGLLRLALEKNRVPPSSPAWGRLQELLALQDPLPKSQEEEQDWGA